MSTTALFPRKTILKALGYMQNASRSSWSHDDGERVFFDAWVNKYADDGRYPMRTKQAYPRPDSSGNVTVGGVTEPARRGHIMWLAHLDLVLAGQRQAILINPVPREAGPRQGDKGAKGWMPRYSTGRITREDEGIWFVTENIQTLDLNCVVKWTIERTLEDRLGNRHESDYNNYEYLQATKTLLQKHLDETKELLRQLGELPES